MEHVQSHTGTPVALPTRRTPPGPPPRLRDALSFLLFGAPRDLVNVYMDAAREFGDAVKFGVRPMVVYFFSHPDHVKRILQDNNANYGKQPIINAQMKDLVGNGLLTSEGDVWRRRRRLLQPAFHRQRIAAFVTVMAEATASLLDRWQQQYERTGQVFDVSSEMRRITIAIVSRVFFGTDVSSFSDNLGQIIATGTEYLSHRSRHPLAFPLKVPTARNRRTVTAIQQLDAIVYRIIGQHRRDNTDNGDLLSMLLAARDEDTGEGLTDQQLRDEVTTFLTAGYDTTAITLSWAWALLSTHPQVRRALQREVAEVLNGRPPTLEDIPRLKYTRMVVDETLRLYPAAWAVARMAISDDEIGGYHVPAKATVIVSPYVTHRHPQFWENPEGFDPERFTAERSAARPRYAYFPFSGGPRQCIGNEFSLLESTVILAMVTQRYDVDLAPGCQVLMDSSFALRPRDGVQVTLHKA